MSLLEVVVYDVCSAITAAACGVDRLEVCDNYYEGGTTPSLGTVSTLKEKLAIPIFPMIRPRGGDFLYNEEEVELMARDIKAFKDLGCEGVVLGILNKDGNVNYELLCKLVEQAYPLDVTFHRAFDRTNNFDIAIQQIHQAGCKRILTSGGYPTVKEGIEELKRIKLIAENKISIVAGGGVNSAVIPSLLSIGIDEIHTPAKKMKPSDMEYLNHHMKETLEHYSIDIEELQNMVSLVKADNINI